MNKVFTFLLFIVSFTSLGQGLLNNGAYLGVSNTAVITIVGSNGHFTNQNSGTSAITDLNGSLYLQGNFINSAAFNSSSGTVTFNGTNAQIIGGNNNSSFYDLVFNNTGTINGANNTITLQKPISPTHGINFTQGILKTDPINILSVGNGILCNVGNVNSFADGPVKKTGTTGFTYPTGDISGSNCIWAPIGTNGIFPLSDISAEYYFTNYGYNLDAGYMCMPSTLDHVSGTEFWLVNSTNSFPAITLYWKDNVRSHITTPADIVVAYWGDCGGSNKWNNVGGIVVDNSGNGYVTSIMPFNIINSPVTFGTKYNTNPLPVDLISFNGNCNNNRVSLAWSTASETNNSFFSVENSEDGFNWLRIATIKGAGNSNQIQNYNYTDENSTYNRIYYRLTQTDVDGHSRNFSPITVSCASSDDDIEIGLFPNPFNDEIILNISNFNYSDAHINVFDIIGNKITERNFAGIQGSTFNTTFNLRDLADGMYFVEIKVGDFQKKIKIVKN